MKKLYYWIYFYLFIHSFIFLALWNMLVYILLHGISEIFLLMFSSRMLMVFWLIVKSFIHLEFIFVNCVKLVVKFLSFLSFFLSFFFACSCPDLPTPFAEDSFYSILCFCPLCQILIEHRDLGLFLGSLFSSIDLCVCSYASTRLFWLPCACNIGLY